jgi:hypothetical protein
MGKCCWHFGWSNKGLIIYSEVLLRLRVMEHPHHHPNDLVLVQGNQQEVP